MKHIYSSYIKQPLTGKKNRIKGVVIHNDAGSMTPSQYHTWLINRVRNGQAGLGFAALYVNRHEALWFNPTDHAEWHTGTQEGNYNYIGLEVCESMPSKTNNATFLANEEATLKVAADIMKSYKVSPNRNTVRLHNEFSSTACPHRSWAIHMGNAPYTQANKNKLKDYFIARIEYYMGVRPVAQPVKAPKPKPVKKKAKTAWGWSGTFTANTTIVVRKLKKGQTAPSMASTQVAKNSWIYKGQWVNWNRLYYSDGMWWIRFKYPTNPASGYFYMPVGKKRTGITFSAANKLKQLWGTVSSMKSKAGNTVTNWSKKNSTK